MVRIRPGESGDLAAVAAIQAASPEASHWPVEDYLGYDFLVAVEEDCVAGFLVSRLSAPDEREILNLAVDPSVRRTGVATALVRALRQTGSGSTFLEVRESNRAAIELYQRLGFQHFGIRLGYYINPPEAAVVMKFQSC